MSCDTRRFNGATAVRPWKTDQAKMVIDHFQVLQWGHGREAVEDSFVMWNRFGIGALQWGHGREAVEDPHRTGRDSACPDCFNGATAVRPWKTAKAAIAC